MPFNNKRNSRDDNSKKGRSNSESFRAKNDRQTRSSSSNEFRKSRSDDRDNKKPNPFAKFEKKGRRDDSDRSFSRTDRFEKRDRIENSDHSFNKGESFDRRGKRKEGDRFSSRADKFDRREGRDNSDRYSSKNDKFEKRDGARTFQKGAKTSYGLSGRSTRSTKKPFDRANDESRDRYQNKESYKPSYPRKKFASADPKNDGLIRLNRYISNSGVCSRRKADELIELGVVSVNGQVVTELGTKVDPAKDEIRYNGERLKREKMVYVLLNKPKDFITTTDDPQERKTVMQLVAKATKERIYPVGRLDRNTTGLLLLTNDGSLAEKLSHPRNNISKIYHVELDKNLTQGDFNKIQFGIELEDGIIKPDDVSYVQGGGRNEIGIQIHSGKNRVVRRIFESLGYEVLKLDRVVYANLTKKDLPRGRWRFLEERELVQLKHFIK